MKLAKTISVLGAVAASAVGGVALGGCGASATLDPVAKAAEVTRQQAGVRVSLSMQMSSPMLPGGIAITASGYFDERRRSGEMSMDLSHVPGVSQLGGDGTVRMVFLYPVVYMNMPFLAGKLPAGKTWMKIDIGKAAQAAGIGGSQLSSVDGIDPTKFLDYLRSSSGVVIAMGQETVNGVLATHYHSTLELSHILGSLPGDQQAAAKAALEQLGESGSIPVDVWIDRQGLVRRIQMTIGGPAAGSGAAGAGAGAGGGLAGILSGLITVDFKRYGAVPPVLAPPADQVFDASALAGTGVTPGG